MNYSIPHELHISLLLSTLGPKLLLCTTKLLFGTFFYFPYFPSLAAIHLTNGEICYHQNNLWSDEDTEWDFYGTLTSQLKQIGPVTLYYFH